MATFSLITNGTVGPFVGVLLTLLNVPVRLSSAKPLLVVAILTLVRLTLSKQDSGNPSITLCPVAPMAVSPLMFISCTYGVLEVGVIGAGGGFGAAEPG